ncbi:MAG: DUF6732 family protein [Pseudomonadota bacterium]
MLSRVVPTLILLATAGFSARPAAAHLGHFGEVAGHSHWIAGAALGLAAAIALWAGTRGRKTDEPSESAPEQETGDEASEP